MVDGQRPRYPVMFSLIQHVILIYTLAICRARVSDDVDLDPEKFMCDGMAGVTKMDRRKLIRTDGECNAKDPRDVPSAHETRMASGWKTGM